MEGPRGAKEEEFDEVLKLVNYVFRESRGQPSEYCGDGKIAPGIEECDGNNLGGATCESLGYTKGNLSCNSNCKLDTTNCVKLHCGNGKCESSLGENCSSCIKDCGCSSGHYCSDGVCREENNNNPGGSPGGGGTATQTTEENKSENGSASESENEQYNNETTPLGRESNTTPQKQVEQNQNFLSGITGAVIGGGRAKYTVPLIFIAIIGIALGIVYFKRK